MNQPSKSLSTTSPQLIPYEKNHRTDPRGKDYYWMTGKFLNMDDGTDTDVQALEDGFASVVPVKIDFTDYEMKETLEKDWSL